MTEEHIYKNNRLYIFFILSLLLNIIILLLIIKINFDQKNSLLTPLSELQDLPISFAQLPPQEQPTQEPPPGQKKEDEMVEYKPAEMRSRPSVFGVTEQAQEIPEFLPGTTDSRAIESYEQSEDVPPVDEKEVTEVIEEKLQEVTKPSPLGSITMQEEKTTLEKQQNQSRKKKKITAKPTRDNTGIGNKNAGPATKQLTFADLARGFLDLQGKGGQDWADMDGDPNLKPDQQQLKLVSYMQKLSWQIQHECALNPYVNDTQIDENAQATFMFIIDKLGNIKNIYITKPSGYHLFDQHALHVIEKAAPYAPIPDHLNKEELQISFTCYVTKAYKRFSYHK